MKALRIPSWQIFLFLALAFLLTNCTSSPELKTYPRAEIDRPYTLPKHVATWKTIMPFGYYSDNTSSYTLPPIPIPLAWQTALSDTWTLNWGPLPLGLSHQIHRTETSLAGLNFGLGLGYGRGSSKVIIAPSAGAFYRQKLSENIALEFSPSVDGMFYTGTRPSSWSVGLGLGPIFQLTPVFALRGRVRLEASHGQTLGTILSSEVTPTPITSFVVPLSVSATWSIHRQWDLDLSYNYSQIGQPNGYQGHTGIVILTHYW